MKNDTLTVRIADTEYGVGYNPMSYREFMHHVEHENGWCASCQKVTVWDSKQYDEPRMDYGREHYCPTCHKSTVMLAYVARRLGLIDID